MYNTRDTRDTINTYSNCTTLPENNLFQKCEKIVPDRYNSISSPSETPIVPDDLNSITKLSETKK